MKSIEEIKTLGRWPGPAPEDAPQGFGAAYWWRHIIDAVAKVRDLTEQDALGERLVAELLDQTRLDEATACRHAMSDEEVAARIELHRKNLRAARRKRA